MGFKVCFKRHLKDLICDGYPSCASSLVIGLQASRLKKRDKPTRPLYSVVTVPGSQLKFGASRAAAKLKGQLFQLGYKRM
jgi:hypothetical protein